jgi:peptidoglycan hydrolase CwlO-like protein
MISLEQVKLLETKVAKAIGYVERVTGENARLLQSETVLLQKEAELRTKVDSYQKRIDELEVLVMRFKEDQSRIEDGILSALDRLNQFEDAIEKSLAGKQAAAPARSPAPAEAEARPPAVETPYAPKKAAPARSSRAASSTESAAPAGDATGEKGEMFSEIPEVEAAEDDITVPLDENDKTANGELDIF